MTHRNPDTLQRTWWHLVAEQGRTKREAVSAWLRLCCVHVLHVVCDLAAVVYACVCCDIAATSRTKGATMLKQCLQCTGGRSSIWPSRRGRWQIVRPPCSDGRPRQQQPCHTEAAFASNTVSNFCVYSRSSTISAAPAPAAAAAAAD